MKNTKTVEAKQDIKVINAYNGTEFMFEGIPSKYKNFFEFDVALIKELRKGSAGKESDVILHKAYFEVH